MMWADRPRTEPWTECRTEDRRTGVGSGSSPSVTGSPRKPSQVGAPGTSSQRHRGRRTRLPDAPGHPLQPQLRGLPPSPGQLRHRPLCLCGAPETHGALSPWWPRWASGVPSAPVECSPGISTTRGQHREDQEADRDPGSGAPTARA